MRVNERGRGMVNILINWQNKIIFFLALMNSAHLSIDVHCNNGANKNRFNSIAAA